MQRQLPLLAELGVPDGQQALALVEITAFQAESLAEPDARGEQQPRQGLRGGGPRCRVQPARRGHQRGDVGFGIQVGRGPPRAAGQQASGRNLRSRVDGGQPSGEPADLRQAPGVPAPGRRGGQRRPAQRQLGGHGVLAGGLGEGGELLQEAARSVQPEAQGTADSQVAGDRLGQAAHRAAPGHGRATADSAA
jgi:hypothetical protein